MCLAAVGPQVRSVRGRAKVRNRLQRTSQRPPNYATISIWRPEHRVRSTETWKTLCIYLCKIARLIWVRKVRNKTTNEHWIHALSTHHKRKAKTLGGWHLWVALRMANANGNAIGTSSAIGSISTRRLSIQSNGNCKLLNLHTIYWYRHWTLECQHSQHKRWIVINCCRQFNAFAFANCDTIDCIATKTINIRMHCFA